MCWAAPKSFKNNSAAYEKNFRLRDKNHAPFNLNGQSRTAFGLLKAPAKTIGHCRSIKSRSNDCRSNKCRSNDCRGNETTPLIRRTFTYIDETNFLMLYKALVRPHLEYANSVWNPSKNKHNTSLEHVQRRATKLIPGLKDMTYEKRLRKFKLPILIN